MHIPLVVGRARKVRRCFLTPAASIAILLDEVYFVLLKRSYLRDQPHVTCTLGTFLRAFAQWAEVEEK